MKRPISLTFSAILLCMCLQSYAQSVGIGTETPNNHAILELVAPNNDQGLLVPRLTTAQRTATAFTTNLSTSENGLLVYDQDLNQFFFWINDQWMELATGNVSGLPDQAGQSGKYLSTDGISASWTFIDFNSLSNIPTGLSDGDDDTQLTDAEIAAMGYIKNANDADADATNELQDLTISGNILSLTGSSSSVDLTPFSGTNTDNQTLSLAGTNLSITGGNTIDVSGLVDDADADPTNEFQDLSLTSNTLSLSNSTPTIDLSPYLDNTDEQNLQFAAGQITLSGDPDATVIDLSNYDSDVTDDFDGAFSSLTGVPTDLADGDDVNDADADATNELQDLSLSTNTLSLSGSAATVDLSGYLDNTDAQDLDFTAGVITLSGDPDATSIDLSNYDTDASDDFDGAFSSLSGIPAGLSDGDDVNDADADATNELQDLSLSTNTLSLSGSAATVDLSGYLDNTDAQDLDFTAGVITLSGDPDATSIDLSNYDTDASDDFDGAFSSLTGVPAYLADGDDVNDADADPTNELQDLSLSTNTLSLSGSAATVDLSGYLDNTDAQNLQFSTGQITLSGDPDNTIIDLSNYDSDVSDDFDGAFSSLTGVPTGLADGDDVNDADADPTNEIELPTQTGQSGNFLTTDGTNPSWSAINQSQWTTNGASINYTAGNVNIGSGTIPPHLLQLSSTATNSTNPLLRLYETDGTSDASINLRSGSTLFTLGVDGSDDYFKISASSTLGNTDRLTIDNSGAIGIGATPFAKLHIGSLTSEAVAIRIGHTYTGAGSMIGVYNLIGNGGTSLKTGIWNSIEGTATSTQQVKGVYNFMSPTDGTTYGVHTQMNAAGSGIRYGTFNDIRSAAGNASSIFGFRANMDHDGTGDSYAFYGQMAGSTTGNKYGVFIDSEELNYFSGHVGIGEQNPDVELTIQSFDINSTNPLIKLISGAATSDAAISLATGGLGNQFMIGVDATDNSFRISDAATLGNTDRLIIDATGNVGINETTPSARLDVVGNAEINGQVAANDYVYTTGNEKSYVYGLSGADFTTGENSLSFPTDFASFYEVRYTGSFYSEFLLRGGSTASGNMGTMAAPIHLPQDATITRIEVYGRNTSSSNAMTVSLVAASYSTGSTTTAIGTIPTSTSTVAQQIDATGLSISIDNVNEKYVLLIDAEVGALGITGVKIHYTKSTLD